MFGALRHAIGNRLNEIEGKVKKKYVSQKCRKTKVVAMNSLLTYC